MAGWFQRMKENMDSTFVFLALGMIITGSVNTISTKVADTQKAVGVDGKRDSFNHPFVQADGMFIGEISCLWVFYISKTFFKKQKEYEPGKEPKVFSPFIFVLPACCDMCATSLMYVGISMTQASVFQMLRGSVIIFTAIFSVIFLKRKLKFFHWIGVVLVLIGLGIVGYASTLAGSSDDAPHPILGDCIIVAAQLVVATQMVVEEKFVGKYNVPPLEAVGWEGLWGLSILSFALIPMYFIPYNISDPDVHHFEDFFDAVLQIFGNPIITLAILGNIVSIGFFNFFGISMTKYASATTRMVLDSVRVLVVWLFSILVGFEVFIWPQLIGFFFLVLGTVIYNGMLKIPFMAKYYDKEEESETRLLQVEDDFEEN